MSAGAVAVLVGLCAAPAAERWDHRGSLGLTLAVGADLRAAVTPEARTDNGGRGDLEVGGTVALTDHLELRLATRGAFFGPAFGLGFLGGLRSMFGERFKTFFDVDLFVVALPFFAAGPHFSFGVLYEVSPVVAVYGGLGAQLGFGDGLRLGGEALVGVQLRSYLLE